MGVRGGMLELKKVELRCFIASYCRDKSGRKTVPVLSAKVTSC